MTRRLLFIVTNIFEVIKRFRRCKFPKTSEGISNIWKFHNLFNVTVNIGMSPEKLLM